MAQKYKAVFIVILYCIVITVCQDPSQELTVREEYIQIFSSIPKLFEYLLDMLEKRPEILENNSYSAFLESNVQREKRENDLQIVDGENDKETNKDEGGDVVDVTGRHEYGYSIKKVKRIKKSHEIHEKKEDNTDISMNKVLNNLDIAKTKRSNEFGESYFGSTNKLSKVSPEDVEEMALKVEKEIEDHVKNRQNRELK